MFSFSKQKTKGAGQDWLKNSSVYQLFVGRSPDASIAAHAGAVFDRLQVWDWKGLVQRHGFDLIYLLGVFDNCGPIVVADEQGRRLDLNAPDRLPSPFAISDHTAPNPKFGTAKSFGKLVSAVQGQNGRVMVDYVGNHTALHHPWIKSHPEYYVRNAKSPDGFQHDFSGDVIKLNYANPQLVDEQIEILRGIVRLGVNGVRCDMAHLQPADFWKKAISAVKSTNPDFVFVAEAYSDSLFCWNTLEDLLKAGFDSVYHEFLYRNLRNVFVNRQPLDYLAGHINFVLKYEHRNRLVNYLANHDDPLLELCTPFQEGLMALVMFMPGTAFICNGQLNGFNRRLAHHTLDLLPPELSEFRAAPPWFDALSQLRREKRPLIASVEHAGNFVLRCSTYLDGQLGKLVVNLGGQAVPAPVSGGKGLLHGLAPGAQLGSGQAELFV